ncbi:V-type ATP synthase subunit F [candidate division KSB1 bacterium]|nr:V-type ATP synthase subunit F [candidate division KSB1 bacterium]
MEYFIIGDPDAVMGFGMVGVKGRVVDGPKEAELTFKDALAQKDVGIIIITERIAQMIRHLVDSYIFTEQFPLIVEIPDRLGKISGQPGIREMVNAAIGIKL